jgi:hypothetical protein
MLPPTDAMVPEAGGRPAMPIYPVASSKQKGAAYPPPQVRMKAVPMAP